MGQPPESRFPRLLRHRCRPARVAPGDRSWSPLRAKTTVVTRIVTADGDLPEAQAGEAVTLTLADEVDVARGDVIAPPDKRPEVVDQFAAHVIWMAEEPHAARAART